MNNNKKHLIVISGYYILAVLIILFFYREEEISSEIVQMMYAVLFLGVLPILLVKRGFGDNLKNYNWPSGYVKKQIILSVSIVWIFSLSIYVFMLQWGGGEVGKKLVWQNQSTFFLMLNNLIILPVGLLAQEFFFRGFLLEVVRKNFNKIISISIIAVLVIIFSVFLAQNMFDWKVVVGIFIVNILLNLLAIRFKSVIFTFFVYWFVVVLLNFQALYQLSQSVK